MTRKNLSLLLCLCLTIAACHKSNSSAIKDIYVAGTMFGPNGGASYWKNGSLVTLPGRGNHLTEASVIAVSGNDVYVAGYVGTDSSSVVAAYWKNGVLTLLADSSDFTTTSGILIDGSDVYICGRGPQGAAYWKNGQRTDLLPGQGQSDALGIAISGSDIYICGQNEVSSSSIAYYWKNGIATPLTTPSQTASASGITVQGGDVYMSGFVSGAQSDTVVYWKNGVRVDVCDTINSLITGGIAVSGGNVYTAGMGYFPHSPGAANFQTSMYYWKNDALMNPGNSMAANFNNMYVWGIAASGSDVYVAGSFNNVPGYWKNGVFNPLSTASGTAFSIALAQ